MLIYLLKVILSNVLSIELSNNLICIQGGRDIKNKRADIKNTLIDLSNNKLNKKHNLFTVDINRMFYDDGINDRINDVTNYVNNFKNDDLFYYGTKITPYLLLNSYFDKLFESGTIDRVNNVIVSVRDYYDDEIYKKIVGSFDNLNAMVVPESTSAAIFKSNSLSLKEFCILNFRGEKVIKSEFNLDNKKLELVKRIEIVSEVNDALIDKLITDLIIKSLKKTNSSIKCIPYDKLEYGYKFTDIKEIKDNVLLKIGQGNTEYTHGYIELFKLNKNKNDEIEISKVAAISELKLDLKTIINVINSVDINSMVDGRDTFIISDYISSKNYKVSNIDIGEICWGNTFISKFDVKDEKICKEVDICKSIIDFKSKKFIIEKARSKLLKFKDSDFKYFSKKNSLDEFKELLEKNREDILDKRILKKVFDSSYEFNKKYDEIKKINNDIQSKYYQYGFHLNQLKKGLSELENITPGKFEDYCKNVKDLIAEGNIEKVEDIKKESMKFKIMIIEEKNLIQSIKKYKTDVDFIKKSINEIVKGKIKFPEVVESEDNFRLAHVVVESIKGEFKNIDKNACKKFDLNDDDVIDNFIGMLKLLFNFKDEDLIDFNLKDSLVIVRDLFEEIRKKKAEEEKELLKKKQEEIKKNDNKEELKEEVNNNEEFKKDNEVKDEIEDNNKNVLL